VPNRTRWTRPRVVRPWVFAKDVNGPVSVTNHSDRPIRDVRVRVGHPPDMNLVWMPNNSTGRSHSSCRPETAVVNGNYSLLDGENTVHPLDCALR
jgi:hypothetical protein